MKISLRNIAMVTILAFVLASCDRTESHWSRAKGENSVKAYQEFLSNHPQGLHVEEARAALHEAEWVAASKSGTAAALEEFRNRYPQSRHVVDAGELFNAVKWRECTTANTPESYRQYLSKHGDSKFARSAIEALLRMSRPSTQEATAYGAAVRANSRSALAGFGKQHPKSDYLFDVNARLKSYGVVKGPAAIEFSDLGKKYNWNGVRELLPIGNSVARMVINGERWCFAPTSLGNLEFDGNTKFGSKVYLEPGASMYYPTVKQAPPVTATR